MISIGASLPTSGTRLGVVIPSRLEEKGRSHHHYQQRNLSLTRSKSIKMDSVTKTAFSSPAPLMLTSGDTSLVNALLSLRALRSLLVLLNGLLLLLLTPFQGRAALFVSSASSALVTASAEKPKGGEKQEGAGGRRSSGAPVVVRVPAAMMPRRAAAARDQGALVRRAMAIRRMAVEEEGEDGAREAARRRSKREFSLFVTARGDTLFTQSWSPVTVPTRGLVVLLHGLNEHSGRYNCFAKQLNDKGFKVYGMDWIGHGGSDGLHGYVHSLDYAASDMKAFLEKVLAENPGLPCFCFGHSTGGAIVLKAALDPKIEAIIEGVVLTSPAVRVQPSHPIVGIIAPIISFLLPRYQFSAADKKGIPVSRDADALIAKYSDPLVFTGSIRVRTGYEILRISNHLQQNLSRVNFPFLVLHGTADTITDPEASQKLYNEASSADKSIKLYDGFLHDLLFEPERDDIASDIINWLSSRLESSSGAQRSD